MLIAPCQAEGLPIISREAPFDACGIRRLWQRLLQLERQSRHYAPARSRVTVRENEQGELAVAYRGRRLAYREIFDRPAPASLSESSMEETLQAANSSAVPSNCIALQQGTFLLSAKRGHF